MGMGISRPWNMTSCGAFRRTSSNLQDPSNYKRIMVVNENHDNASADSRSTTQGQKNSSSLPEKDGANEEKKSTKKDVVNEEKKSTSPININNYQQEDEEMERISDYDGPMFMKSPSFRDFVRPKDLIDASVKKGKKGGEMRENKTEAQDHPGYVCTAEVCMREEKKNETPAENKEAGSGKEKRIYKIFSQQYKPSTVSGGVKSLFNHQPKHSKQPN